MTTRRGLAAGAFGGISLAVVFFGVPFEAVFGLERLFGDAGRSGFLELLLMLLRRDADDEREALDDALDEATEAAGDRSGLLPLVRDEATEAAGDRRAARIQFESRFHS